ncbi:aminotransferase class V-fold PLP-dependent enzyme [Bacillus salipaludis]|uniref:aminotransferase class V-fold PLP-dependent enzyme n=1 Tax=Bacillus salipaludis TaxID=2547811 RepID=UPI002E2493BA|nr:aminotransferase class V-fold PLP-dependent enzyme [Bacillus salipaludis]
MFNLEKYFQTYKDGIIGNNQFYKTPFGEKKICYADWTASGRFYRPIEDKIMNQFGPYIANTHTETNVTGKTMTEAYFKAKQIIKKHVNGNENDVLLFEGTGMTGALCKLQRILGLSVNERIKSTLEIDPKKRPVVFITHMEHHSNQTTWEETIAEVVIVPPNSNGEVSPSLLESLLIKYQDRALKIGSFTSCSNVTGILTPYHELAKMMHKYGGYCFVDFSASAPYIDMDMHPEDPSTSLDAIFFSPHKFLGGPSSSGVVIFSKDLYTNQIPDRPGGGTVNWTNPWGEKSYIENIEEREDGGTPGFIQAIRASLSIKLKEKMGTDTIKKRDNELVKIFFDRLQKNPQISFLEGDKKERLPIISFYIEGIHHNLIVKLLNDVHGIQVRGGCSCAGTYGHYLLKINKSHSKTITAEIDKGNINVKPGWVRVSLHPTTSSHEVHFIVDSINDIIKNIDLYSSDYCYCSNSNEFIHKNERHSFIDEWFEINEQSSYDFISNNPPL